MRTETSPPDGEAGSDRARFNEAVRECGRRLSKRYGTILKDAASMRPSANADGDQSSSCRIPLPDCRFNEAVRECGRRPRMGQAEQRRSWRFNEAVRECGRRLCARNSNGGVTTLLQ